MNTIPNAKTPIENQKFTVTGIQFFDYSDENSDSFKKSYSANVIINDTFVVQVSGNEEEANASSIPDAALCHWKDDEIQDWATENVDVRELMEAIEADGLENNFYYLSENGDTF